MSWICLIVLTFLSVVLCRALWRYGNPNIRFPFACYLGFYASTTFLGAVLIGITNQEVLDSLNWGVDLSVLKNLDMLTYWGLLFAPLIIPTMCLLLFNNSKTVHALVAHQSQRFSGWTSITSLLFVFGLITGYCVFRLAMVGHLGGILMWRSLQDDYLSMITQRHFLVSSLGSFFFGFSYITLPTLSFVALANAVRRRETVWWCVFIGTALVVCVNNLSLMQKSPTLLYLVFVGIALIELEVLRLRSLVSMAVMLIAALTVLQSFTITDWSWRQSVDLLVFRMAHSFPYYVDLFPDVIPYVGIDYGQGLVGLGTRVRESRDVLNYMYNTSGGIEGDAPGPAHVRAYAQAGPIFSAVTLMIIGIAISAIGSLRQHRKNPMCFALYMQSLVFLYFVTQTSLREAIISCYGIFFAYVGLVPLQWISGGARSIVARPTNQLSAPHFPRVGAKRLQRTW